MDIIDKFLNTISMIYRWVIMNILYRWIMQLMYVHYKQKLWTITVDMNKRYIKIYKH